MTETHLLEDGRVRKKGSKRRNVFPGSNRHLSSQDTLVRHTGHFFLFFLVFKKSISSNCSQYYLVCCVISTWVFHLHQDVRVQKIGGDYVWDKWRGFLLEDRSHDIVSYVPLPLKLSRQEGTIFYYPESRSQLCGLWYLRSTFHLLPTK